MARPRRAALQHHLRYRRKWLRLQTNGIEESPAVEVIADRNGRRFFTHTGSLPSSVAPILAAIADVLAPVATILEPIAPVLAPIPEIFQSIAQTTIPLCVASIFEPIATVFPAVANVLATIAPIFTPITNVLEPIAELAPRTLRRLCGYWHQQCHE
jgi:hypothetical protein